MSGVEPVFGIDNFEGPKYNNETEMIANGLLNIIFGKPGFFPSMPDLGMNIQEYLYTFWDEVDPTIIKAKIISQCSVFSEFVDDGSLDVVKSSYMKKPLLLIVLPVIIKETKEKLGIGISQDENGNTIYNYQFIEENS